MHQDGVLITTSVAAVTTTMTMNTLSMLLSVCLLAASADAFARPAFSRNGGAVSFRLHASLVDLTPPPPAAVNQVVVLEDAAAVGDTVRNIVAESAAAAIADHGYFALAIPGGSILKMLVGSDILGSWTSKTTIAYVNHKCVPIDDMDLATHAKARNLFMDQWEGVNAIVMDGTASHAEAASYEAKLKALSEKELPRDSAGLPVFDLALIGVGDDGHVGSLYPGRDEVLSGPDGVSALIRD